MKPVDLFALDDRIALVTGGAQGLGRMIAQGLSDAGARVFITSRNTELCRQAATEIGGACRALPGDAGSPEGIRNLGEQYRAAGESHLDILVNNAGRTWGAPLESFPDKAWPGVMAVNVQAPFRAVQEFLPELRAAATANARARIINIGSVAGRMVNDLQAYSYGASKAALHHLTRQLAADLSKDGINVNAILPGYFPTSMTSHLRSNGDDALAHNVPLGHIGEPADIAGAVIYLCSRAGAYVTGIELRVDGGLLCRA